MKRLFLFSALVLFMSSCKEEVHYTSQQFEGYWTLEEAQRDGRITNTLRGAWVKIKGDEMKDNFFSSEVSYPFSLDGAKLVHHTDPKRTFEVVSIERDTLVLKTKHMDYDFEFKFKKANK